LRQRALRFEIHPVIPAKGRSKGTQGAAPDWGKIILSLRQPDSEVETVESGLDETPPRFITGAETTPKRDLQHERLEQLP